MVNNILPSVGYESDHWESVDLPFGVLFLQAVGVICLEFGIQPTLENHHFWAQRRVY